MSTIDATFIEQIKSKPESERTDGEKGVLELYESLSDEARNQLVSAFVEKPSKLSPEEQQFKLTDLQSRAAPLVEERKKLEEDRDNLGQDADVAKFFELRREQKEANKRVQDLKKTDAVKTLLETDAKIKEATVELRTFSKQIAELGGKFPVPRIGGSKKGDDEQPKRKRGEGTTKKRERDENERKQLHKELKKDKTSSEKSDTKAKRRVVDDSDQDDDVHIGIAPRE
jgi:hypothetical protein